MNNELHDGFKLVLKETQDMITKLPAADQPRVEYAAKCLRAMVMAHGHVAGLHALQLVYAEAMTAISEDLEKPNVH